MRTLSKTRSAKIDGGLVSGVLEHGADYEQAVAEVVWRNVVALLLVDAHEHATVADAIADKVTLPNTSQKTISLPFIYQLKKKEKV